MAKGTKKVGITGKYGPRYGVKIRKQILEASRHRLRPQRCPECQHDAVKRVSSGIWLCNHCKLKFAAAAYSIRTRSFKRTVTRSRVGEYLVEDEIIEEEAPLEEPAATSGKPEKPVEGPKEIPVPEAASEELAEEEAEPEEEPESEPEPEPEPPVEPKEEE